ncbi:MAG: glucosyl-3-phosphoglycerate synthase [Thermoleophilaceae bacterium]|nr:glucosyl-3-phosphoglycerate synthase [Thermoleophilaceae bacterium]
MSDAPTTTRAVVRAELARSERWAGTNTFDGAEFSAARIAELRGDTTISVVIPVKEAAMTVGRVAASCLRLRDAGAIDQVIVVDADSADGSAQAARSVGAEVHQESELLAEFGPPAGKGDALWRGLSVATGDITVFVDSDSEAFDGSFVTGLAGPLLVDPALQLVKGAFDRPFTSAGVRIEGGGGRVNELVARPLLNMYFPELAAVRQPLAGEIAARRCALAAMPFTTGYGVETQLLIEFYKRFGLEGIAQSDIGERLNQHQQLEELAPMAYAVLSALLAGSNNPPPELEGAGEFLGYFEGEIAYRDITPQLRPPLDSLGSPSGA